MVPCYNEEENVVPMSEALIAMFAKDLPQYDYEILFIDNHSTDTTRVKLRKLCQSNSKIKAIFNAKNFGQFNSPYYGLLQTTGDCVVSVCADFQDPVEMVPKFVAEWEKGYKIVIGRKTSSKENKLMYALRGLYYKAIRKMSSVEQIEQFTGFGLYDKDFIQVLRDLHDPTPFIRGIVAELGYERKELEYEQPQRRAGKTHNNWYSLFDAAMLSFTSYTKIFLRLPAILGGAVSGLSFLGAIIYLIFMLINGFTPGVGAVMLLIAFVSGVQLFFIGMIGEYILGINERVKNRPLVVEEERLNF